jgi:hypothetical protein
MENALFRCSAGRTREDTTYTPRSRARSAADRRRSDGSAVERSCFLPAQPLPAVSMHCRHAAAAPLPINETTASEVMVSHAAQTQCASGTEDFFEMRPLEGGTVCEVEPVHEVESQFLYLL